MPKSTRRFKAAAKSLQEIMENIGPYVHRPVIEDATTKERWIRTDAFFGDRISQTKGERLTDQNA